MDLSNINPATPIAIKAYINQLKEPVMGVIEMNPRPITVEDVAKTIYSGAKLVKDEIVGTFTDVKSIVSGGLTYIGFQDLCYLNSPELSLAVYR